AAKSLERLEEDFRIVRKSIPEGFRSVSNSLASLPKSSESALPVPTAGTVSSWRQPGSDRAATSFSPREQFAGFSAAGSVSSSAVASGLGPVSK
ncbi:unnamed protein product, partial [Polarella glacialis]